MVTAIHLLPHIHNTQKMKAIFLRSCSSIKISKSLRKENRIGVLGVCAGGGYAVNAAMTKRRIKAGGTAAGANIGRVQRESRNPIPVLKEAARQRTPEARGGDPLSQTGFPAAGKKGRRRASTSENLLVLEH
ncbi:dienelactone hydrolase family protein [Enterocloster clostridioformis]|jgi:hypothetical protein|uniref:Uncharacterized protein n=2 Tax=Enterocloster clostridioformis TaxID=1531 RepID=A0AAP9S7H7_9FIRM|nr:dienelactone hydrolase family protein [Enterocloster clostridioformis]MBE7716928.1 hypothetical protein [Enterocloster clostridioformis]MBS7005515.1 dienelactone hydrolase family protein [Enterocloster clostridioformis]MCF2703988.1 dienelactone hydrolase family protein [Enterocloster clostridioformis]NSD57890.1 hypothetical protein [Enterocloster clostridioformis]NSJ11899.1 hypothetical protein [Enterocloster clostridioformis]